MHRYCQLIAFCAWSLIAMPGCSQDTDGDSRTPSGDMDSEQDMASGDDQTADATPTGQTVEGEPFTLVAGVNELTWEEELSIGTTTRHLVIHTPQSYPNHGPLPILFAFHGNAADAPETAEPEKMWLGKLGPMVDQEKFIGIYLRGIAGEWQLGPEGGDITTEEVIATIRYLKARMAASPSVDPDVTYCFGTSNGAALCQYTAANIGLFNGIGAEVSSLDEGDYPEPDLPKVSVVQMLNLKDRMIPYEGGASQVGHTYMPAEDGAAAWAAHNGCDPTPATQEVAEPYKRTLTYPGCAEGTIVVHVGAMPIPWADSCESGGPPDREICGVDHTVADEHFERPGGPWRYAFDLLSAPPSQ